MCKKIGLTTFPRFNKKLLKIYGLNTVLPAWPMPGWHNMLFQKKIISIRDGLVFYSVGQKDFWGKSSFFDPLDNVRYQLWYGMYLVPLDKIFEIINEEQIPVDKFGYNKNEKEFDFSHALLLIQYDLYSYLFIIINYLSQNMRKPRKILKEFEFHNLSVKAIDTGVPFCWRFKGNVGGKSLMYYKNSLAYKAYSSLMPFGWVAKNDQGNFSESIFKGDFTIRYLDRNANTIDPESPEAKYLFIGYLYGIYWETSEKKETPDDVMNNLAQTFLDQNFKIFKGNKQ